MLSGTFLEEGLEYLTRIWRDWIASLYLKPCDVVIAMSGCFNLSLLKARRKWGAFIVVERGSRHILSQKQILDAVRKLHPQAKTVPDVNVRWELRDYERADRISVPSRHVVKSFTERGVDESRLFRNPYGVDLSMFSPTPLPEGPLTLLMVGTWCYRKGCDLLVEATRHLDFEILHAGVIGDYPFPTERGYKSFGKLDQTALKEIYAQAHVMVLPSREDGFGVVQAQALACGVAVVCSDRTGGEDLREFLEDPSFVTVVKSDDARALQLGVQEAIRFASTQKNPRSISKDSLKKMSWEAYGYRYDRFLRDIALVMAV
jgi:glycosyltransferase involved in cell wall biosynthesis